MAIEDTEPQYQLVDSNGNIVGNFVQNSSGDVVLQTPNTEIALNNLIEGIDVDDSGTDVLANAVGIDFSTNLDVTDDGDGTVTVTASGGGGLTTTTINDTDSPYLTSDEDVIYCDTSTGAVTVTLSSTDATLGNEIRVLNVDATNAVTVDTEGTETIDPSGVSSKQITKAGWSVGFTSDGANWDSSLAGEFDSVNTVEAKVTNETKILAERANAQNSIASGTYVNIVDKETQDNRGELNSNLRFVPDKDGLYSFAGAGVADVNDGDILAVRLRNITDGATVGGRLGILTAGGGGDVGVPFAGTRVLTSGKTYEVQMTDFDSSWNLRSGVDGAYSTVSITRGIIQ